jgi:hypothetical protein
MNTDQHNHVRAAVLQAKSHLEAVLNDATDTPNIDRVDFVSLCTAAAKKHIACAPAVGNSDAAMRRLVIHELSEWRARPVEASPPRIVAGVTLVPKTKVAVVTATKSYLQPLYSNGTLTRDDFGATVLRLSEEFGVEFSSRNTDAPLTTGECDWIAERARQEGEDATKTSAAKNATPPATSRASPSMRMSSTRSQSNGDATSPFDEHLSKLRRIAEGTAVAAATPQPGDDAARRRVDLVGEISDVTQQLAQLQLTLAEKVEELRNL